MITTRVDFQMNTENNESQRGSSKQPFIQYFLFIPPPNTEQQLNISVEILIRA